MTFSSFGEFLRWAHQGNYSNEGMAATASYNDVHIDQNDIVDAKNMASAGGDINEWPTLLEQIILTNLRENEGYDESLGFDV